MSLYPAQFVWTGQTAELLEQAGVQGLKNQVKTMTTMNWIAIGAIVLLGIFLIKKGR